MSLQSLGTAAIEMRIAILWFILFTLNSLGTCFLAASAGCVWQNLGTQEKLTVIVAIFVNWTGTIMAYLSKASKRIEHGELPIGLDTASEQHDIPKQTSKP